MCTAATYTTKDFYFGRNLDYEFSYGDEVTVKAEGPAEDEAIAAMEKFFQDNL